IAGYLPNIPEATISLLAAMSIGAVWSSCSPDFGAASVMERFQQIEPKILIAVDGYMYNGRAFSRINDVKAIKAALSSVEKLIRIPFSDSAMEEEDIAGSVMWDEV